GQSRRPCPNRPDSLSALLRDRERRTPCAAEYVQLGRPRSPQQASRPSVFLSGRRSIGRKLIGEARLAVGTAWPRRQTTLGWRCPRLPGSTPCLTEPSGDRDSRLHDIDSINANILQNTAKSAEFK